MLPCTEALVKKGERARGGLAASCVEAPCQDLAARAVQGRHLPSPPRVGEIGAIFLIWSQGQPPKKAIWSLWKCGGRAGRVGQGSQSIEVRWFPNMSLTAWMLYISAFCLILAVKESMAWAGKLSSVSHVPKWKLLIISRPSFKKIVSKTGRESKVVLFQNGFIFKESALFDKKVSWAAPLA